MSPQRLASGGDNVREDAFDLILTDTGHLETSKHSQGSKKKLKPLWSDFGFVGEIGYSVALPIVFGALGGAAIDRGWHTYPKGTLGGIGIGVLLSFASLYHTVKKLLSETRSH